MLLSQKLWQWEMLLRIADLSALKAILGTPRLRPLCKQYIYDFQRPAWLLFNVQVSEIPKALIQENKLHSGYIFYRQNAVFEQLGK